MQISQKMDFWIRKCHLARAVGAAVGLALGLDYAMEGYVRWYILGWNLTDNETLFRSQRTVPRRRLGTTALVYIIT